MGSPRRIYTGAITRYTSLCHCKSLLKTGGLFTTDYERQTPIPYIEDKKRVKRPSVDRVLAIYRDLEFQRVSTRGRQRNKGALRLVVTIHVTYESP